MTPWQEANHERHKAYLREHYRQNKHRWQTPQAWASRALYKAKKRAQKDEREFSITQQDILDVWPCDGKCPVLGITLVVGETGGRRSSPSLDRIDNNRGYLRGNICVISQRANQLKSNATHEELKRLLRYVGKFLQD